LGNLCQFFICSPGMKYAYFYSCAPGWELRCPLVCCPPQEAVILGSPGRTWGAAGRPGRGPTREWAGDAAIRTWCNPWRAAAAGDRDRGPVAGTPEPKGCGASAPGELSGKKAWDVLVGMGWHFSRASTQGWVRNHTNVLFLVKKLPCGSSNWLGHLASPREFQLLQCLTNSIWPGLFCNLSKCVVKIHCGPNLHFPSNYWCAYRPSLYHLWRNVYSNTLLVILVEFITLLLSCKSSFYVLDIRLLSDICLTNFFFMLCLSFCGNSVPSFSFFFFFFFEIRASPPVVLEMGSHNFLPMLASNCNPPHLSLPSSYVCRCEPPVCLAKLTVFLLLSLESCLLWIQELYHMLYLKMFSPVCDLFLPLF
jgi:hypothetical protein